MDGLDGYPQTHPSIGNTGEVFERGDDGDMIASDIRRGSELRFTGGYK